MSTETISGSADRIAALAQRGEVIFHVDDLAMLWNIRMPNTLYTALKRYTQSKLLFRLQKGLYSLLPPEKLEPRLIGVKWLHRYSYISTETILSQAGVLSQVFPVVTLVSSVSRQFQLAGHSFRSRQLKDAFLFNSAGISEDHGVKLASPERAVADLLYFNPHAHLDVPTIVDFREVNRLQKEIGYHVTP